MHNSVTKFYTKEFGYISMTESKREITERFSNDNYDLVEDKDSLTIAEKDNESNIIKIVFNNEKIRAIDFVTCELIKVQINKEELTFSEVREKYEGQTEKTRKCEKRGIDITDNFKCDAASSCSCCWYGMEVEYTINIPEENLVITFSEFNGPTPLLVCAEITE